MSVYSGSNNGMRKMSKVFRGEKLFGQVELKNIHRSEIAAIADKMK
jgi:predicted ribonuclease YlaK